MLMANDEFVKNDLVTNDGLMVGDDVYDQSTPDIKRQRTNRGFELAAGEGNRHWFVLMCRTGSELLIRDELENRNIGVFAPKKNGKKKQHRGRWIKLPDRAVFGGYVFVHVPYDGDVFTALTSFDQAYGLLRRDEWFVRINETNMLKMMIKDQSGQYCAEIKRGLFGWIRLGMKVRITDGAFFGQDAIVNRVMGDEIEVIIKIMGCDAKKKMPLDSIEERT